MTLGMPEINISFNTLAKSAIERGSRGTVALILKDNILKTEQNTFKITDITEIPKTLNEKNIEQVKLALKGGYKATNKVLVFVCDSKSKVVDILQKTLQYKYDYLVIPEVGEEKEDIVTFIKNTRDKKHRKIKAVLPNCKADNEGIINFTSEDIKTEKKTYKTEEYCSRIAGILATTPLNISATYYVLAEVLDVKAKENDDECVNAGELFIFNDGEKCKLSRAVNSLTTIAEGKSEDFKKIKIIDAMDLIYTDIRKTFEDNYIGKVSNNLDNKMIFITTVNAYFKSLEKENVLNAAENKSFIDIEAQKLYIASKGVDISTMQENEILNFNTGSKFFLAGKVSILDAMEDLYFNVEV